ncbi:MAG TPA: 50S ribosomal protein L3, partial [Candidatus Nanoarchaeia archaeon]|nr:50S ribosomal protein L3 [Candidatus Nanoarchaeia archaeon]
MGQPNKPRSGSMQFWPRKRARRIYARIRSWPSQKEAKPLGFAGYKVGMCHAMVVDNRKNALTKGEEISVPLTILECPPLKVYGARFYRKSIMGTQAIVDVTAKADKELARKLPVQKKEGKKLEDIPLAGVEAIYALVYTQPKLVGFGKKKPELFEIAIGGNVEEQFAFMKERLGKDLSVKEVLREGAQLDVHAVTRGKGVQGPVKRFGVSIRQHKAEKTKRGPGSLGAWRGQGHMMYRVAHAGQMGFHTRTEYNKWLIKIEDDMQKINRLGGFKHYGVVRNPCILLKGSV